MSCTRVSADGKAIHPHLLLFPTSRPTDNFFFHVKITASRFQTLKANVYLFFFCPGQKAWKSQTSQVTARFITHTLGTFESKNICGFRLKSPASKSGQRMETLSDFKGSGVKFSPLESRGNKTPTSSLVFSASSPESRHSAPCVCSSSVPFAL